MNTKKTWVLLGLVFLFMETLAITIDTASLPTGTVAEAYSETLSASGGTAPYKWNIRVDYDESIVTNHFLTATHQQSTWTNDASAWNLQLPFTFPLYGVGYTQCWVSSEGYVHFDSAYVNENPSTNALATNAMATAIWTDIESNLDIFLLTNDIQCIIRWVGYTMMANYVDVSLELNKNGTLRINPGTEFMMGASVCGISSGNGIDVLISTNAGGGQMPGFGEFVQFEPQDGLPDALSLSGNEIVGFPSATGSVDVVFVVQDATDAITNKTLTLVVEENTNDQPIIQTNTPTAGAFSMNSGTNQLFSVTAEDPESEPLSYAWTWDGSSVGSNAASFAHSSDWSDEGEHTLRVNVHDDFWTNGQVFSSWTVTIRSDNDGDGMPNAWERAYDLNPNNDDSALDSDSDELTHLQEYQNGCNPTNSDTDGDTLIDGWEVAYSTNPTNVTEAIPGYTNFQWSEVFSLDAPAQSVFLNGTNLFAACAFGGMKVFDTANPDQINPLDMTETSYGLGTGYGSAKDLVVVDDKAYLCSDEQSLQVWDVSDPSDVVLLGEYTADSGTYYSHVQVTSNRAYLARNVNLEVLDISQPTNITRLGEIRIASTNGAKHIVDLEIKGNRAYCANYDEGLKTVDISNPASMTIIATNEFEFVGTCGYAARGLDRVGDTLLMAQDGYGVMTFDISGGTPVLLGYERPTGMPFPYDFANDVSADGTIVCVVGGTNLWVVDFNTPTNLVTRGVWTNSFPNYLTSVSFTNNIAAVSMGDAGVQLIDISNPDAPISRGCFDTSGQPYDMEVSGSRAYVANGEAGLHIIDFSTPTNWTRIGRFDTDGIARGIDVSDAGDTVCIADGSNGVIVLDTSAPSSITQRSHYDTAGFAWGVAHGNGGRVFVADGSGGLVVVTNLDAPVLETNFTFSGTAYDVEMYGSQALVASGGTGFKLFYFGGKDTQIWHSASCDYSADVGGSIYAKRVTGGGGYAWVADWHHGAVAIALSDDTPTYAGHHDPGTASGESIYHEYGDHIWLGTSTNAASLFMNNPANPRALTGWGNGRRIPALWVDRTNGLLIANDTWRKNDWYLYGFTTARIDSDEDGLNDIWETNWFGDLDQNRTSDFDGDGLSEWGEALLDLDPTDNDFDNDGLNDGDEDNNGTDPTDFDTDDDGVSDGDEVRAGSDPASDGSLFQLLPLQVPPLLEGFIIRWNSFDGHTYNIHRIGNLIDTNTWLQIATNLPATPPINTYTDTVFRAAHYFYRIDSAEE